MLPPSLEKGCANEETESEIRKQTAVNLERMPPGTIGRGKTRREGLVRTKELRVQVPNPHAVLARDPNPRQTLGLTPGERVLGMLYDDAASDGSSSAAEATDVQLSDAESDRGLAERAPPEDVVLTQASERASRSATSLT